MKVLFHYDAGTKLREELAGLAEQGIEVVCCPEGQSEPFETELADAEAIWHVLQPITAEVIARAPKLRLIQKIGVGVNTIDLDAARARNIAVCNMPGTNSRAVAEMTLLLMLAALRKLPRIDRVCRSGQWAPDRETRETFGEVGGRTIGFVGYGGVPTILAPILEAMGANIVYTATSKKNVEYPFLSLDEVLATADIVSLHLPLSEATEKMIDSQRLASMKPGSILVNTARGGLVDEQALLCALQDGNLSAAGLDVFYSEPVSEDNPLLALDNVAVAPHVAWLTEETFSRSTDIALHNTLAIRNGSALLHQVT